jgi:hypothetical protein
LKDLGDHRLRSTSRARALESMEMSGGAATPRAFCAEMHDAD